MGGARRAAHGRSEGISHVARPPQRQSVTRPKKVSATPPPPSAKGVCRVGGPFSPTRCEIGVKSVSVLGDSQPFCWHSFPVLQGGILSDIRPPAAFDTGVSPWPNPPSLCPDKACSPIPSRASRS